MTKTIRSAADSGEKTPKYVNRGDKHSNHSCVFGFLSSSLHQRARRGLSSQTNTRGSDKNMCDVSETIIQPEPACVLFFSHSLLHLTMFSICPENSLNKKSHLIELTVMGGLVPLKVVLQANSVLQPFCGSIKGRRD